jgi:hypothetical protein
MKQRSLAVFKRLFFIVVLAGLLSACADEQAVILGPQQWQDLGVRVETRPSPLRVGMNEFIVIASREEYKPGVGLVVMLRVNENGKWRQAIQDGFTGVYRRAVQVDDPATQSLTVHIRRSGNKDETTLSFPLNQRPDLSR